MLRIVEGRAVESVDRLIVRRRFHDLGIAISLINHGCEHFDPTVDFLFRPHLSRFGGEGFSGTSQGSWLAELLAGAVLTEQIFTIPGFGKLIVDAVFNRDYAVVQGVVLCTAVGFILMNLLADILYFVLNPRMRTAL